ncbi:ImcF-related family protein [Paraburkholderia bannensis]|uniref:ImcF-related family protein n=1 Tax=Paraburkholderia bannensis TaxID=765414 RepID=UPI002AB72233|nr:ImcF-related family protein [Paraburkholderia bannensis]
MKNEKGHNWGRWMMIAALFVGSVGLLLSTVDRKGLFASIVEHWWRIAFAALLAVGGLGLLFRHQRAQRQIARRQESVKQGHVPPGRINPAADAAKSKADEVVSWAKNLKTDLKQRRRFPWFNWEYTRPWILVAGETTTLTAWMPQLATKGFLITDAAVLLWGGADKDGQPEERWLRQIRWLRWRKPLDAVALVTDDQTFLSASVGERTSWSNHLERLTSFLRWSAPVYVLDVAATSAVHRFDTPVTGCELSRPLDASVIESRLLELRDQLADRSVYQLADDSGNTCAAELSKRLDERSAPLARWIAGLTDWQRRPFPVAGAFFAPWAASDAAAGSDSSQLPLWRHLADATRRTPGRRTLSSPFTVASIVALAFIGLWSAGMLVSAMNNAHEVMLTSESLQALNRAGDTPGRLRTLLALQQRIGLHEARVQEHAPLLTRFGLNHDRAVLDALWTPYAHAARPLLVSPVQQDIEGQLVDLGQMQTAQVDTQSSQMAQDGQQALKTYLMLAEPQRADAAFMTPQLEHHWNLDIGLRPGERLDLSAQLMGFWAQHFPAHPDWRIQPREDLVGNARQTLLAIIGVKNSEDTIYQGMLDSVGHKYPLQTLASLTAGTDTRGVFSTSAAVPGVFTRQAWEGSIEAAIDEAAKQNGVTANWVLGNTGSTGNGQAGPDAQTPDALRAALRKHYFDDYAEHWQEFMNSIRCAAAPTLPAAVGQLKLIADARQSPLIALMKSLAWQGGAGVQQASLSDALVTKAQNFFGKKDDAPQNTQAIPAGPLDASFGPVVKLVGQAGISSNAAPAAGSDLSMERFTERVMTLRLKLQQISDSADSDDRARQVAQALYQGKGSDLSDTLAYAKLIAASLGEQWAGMGNALFVEPVAQATRTVLAPAQASLNDAWREMIVTAWNRSFAGRYPFANTTNDASLPELARFLRPQAGLIDNFLSTQLAGALQLQGDEWVATSGGAGVGSTAIAFDPAFLKAINTLQQVAGHLLAQGEPQYVFSLKPVPTPGVADTLLTLDGQTLHYYNQVETWSTMTWPSGEPQKAGTRLEWQTDTAGTNKNFEFGGRWALLRMLERARVEPVDSATYQLTWQTKPADTDSKPAATTVEALTDLAAQVPQEPLAPAPAGMTHPLRYLIRTDVGRGPLELLALRGFTLPSRIFIDRSTSAARPAVPAGPPPLPRAAIVAAKQAAVSLPTGIAP